MAEGLAHRAAAALSDGRVRYGTDRPGPSLSLCLHGVTLLPASQSRKDFIWAAVGHGTSSQVTSLEPEIGLFQSSPSSQL